MEKQKLVLCEIVKKATGLPNVIANIICQYDDTRRPYYMDSFDFLMELADILKGYLFGKNPDPKKVRTKLKLMHKTIKCLNIKNHGIQIVIQAMNFGVKVIVHRVTSRCNVVWNCSDV
jgi:hypothetical protein